MARGVAESGNPWRRTRLGAARASRCCCCPQQRHTRWPAEVLSWLGGDGRQRPTSRRCRYGRQGLRWWGARATCTSLLVFMHSLPPFPPRFSIVAAPIRPSFSALVAFLPPSFSSTRCPPSLLVFPALVAPCLLFFCTRCPPSLSVLLHSLPPFPLRFFALAAPLALSFLCTRCPPSSLLFMRSLPPLLPCSLLLCNVFCTRCPLLSSQREGGDSEGKKLRAKQGTEARGTASAKNRK